MATALQDFMACSIPCSRLLPCLVLLLALLLTMTFSWLPNMHQDLSRQPMMDKDMLQEMGNKEITSDFTEASIEDVKHQMERHLYLAIVHASIVLGNGHVSSTNNTDDEHDVKREVEAYLQGMLERMKNMDLLEYAGAKDEVYQLSRHLYQAVLRANVIQSLATETRILEEEKGFVSTAWQDFMAWSIPCSLLLVSLLLLALLYLLYRSLLKETTTAQEEVLVPEDVIITTPDEAYYYFDMPEEVLVQEEEAGTEEVLLPNPVAHCPSPARPVGPPTEGYGCSYRPPPTGAPNPIRLWGR